MTCSPHPEAIIARTMSGSNTTQCMSSAMTVMYSQRADKLQGMESGRGRALNCTASIRVTMKQVKHQLHTSANTHCARLHCVHHCHRAHSEEEEVAEAEEAVVEASAVVEPAREARAGAGEEAGTIAPALNPPAPGVRGGGLLCFCFCLCCGCGCGCGCFGEAEAEGGANGRARCACAVSCATVAGDGCGCGCGCARALARGDAERTAAKSNTACAPADAEGAGGAGGEVCCGCCGCCAA